MVSHTNVNELPHLTVPALAELSRAGDRDAFAELFRRFRATVHGITLTTVHNKSEASDVTQDVFARALEKIDQLRHPEHFGSWLCRIARNIAFGHNRANRHARQLAIPPESIDGKGEAESVSFDQLAGDEGLATVLACLQQLKPLDRQTLLAFYVQGAAVEQMANMFRAPIGTIKRRLHYARARLRALVNRATRK